MVNLEIYDVTSWKKNNCNTHIVQCFKKKRQSDCEIWLVNKRNMGNTFLEKLYIKCGGRNIPRSFSKISKLSISLDQQSKVLQFVFIVCQVKGYQNILKLSCTPLAFSSYKAFRKNKKSSGSSLPASLSAWSLKKNIYLVIFY